ncbi:hypothetical protein Enr13x_11560 [Stieleria neptunia]|uniref:Nucleotidyl transferase AbiEii toxin, Type IV TA system n=1 Tax=Stieleria neptunia TaxID=2527979 RepID=A0A518HKF0_9BACT|nr:nucleotidyltransferase [Stieleria neptunia]QDV41318.1 hypothetical protein Enr13x_11560 [Stieleria neptunia]
MKRSEKNVFGDNNVLRFAAEISQVLVELELDGCVIGGVANQRWGEPRQTADVDVTISLTFGAEMVVAQQLLDRFESRIENPKEFALANRILLLESDSGIGLDASLGGFPFEQRMMNRASDWIVPKHGVIRTCSAEDLIVLKAFAARPQDWIDLEKVIVRQGDRLDRDLIRTELAPLVELKEEPEIMTRLDALL